MSVTISELLVKIDADVSSAVAGISAVESREVEFIATTEKLVAPLNQMSALLEVVANRTSTMAAMMETSGKSIGVASKSTQKLISDLNAVAENTDGFTVAQRRALAGMLDSAKANLMNASATRENAAAQVELSRAGLIDTQAGLNASKQKTEDARALRVEQQAGLDVQRTAAELQKSAASANLANERAITAQTEAIKNQSSTVLNAARADVAAAQEKLATSRAVTQESQQALIAQRTASETLEVLRLGPTPSSRRLAAFCTEAKHPNFWLIRHW